MKLKISLVLQIQTNYNQLTKAEKKVADYVIANKDKVLYMSITDLATACQVGETSVYRFCRKMNFTGYQEFKMQLSLFLAGEGVTESAKAEDDSISIEKLTMQRHMQAIEESYQLLDFRAVDSIVTMIETSRKIFFFGVGDSLQTAQEAWNKFMRITDKVLCITDPHMQAMATSLATEEDLIILVSYSGATKDIIHIAKEARNVKAKVACITHYKQSPLIPYVDEFLLCGSQESPLEGGSMPVKIGQLYLVDILYQKYYRRNKKESSQNQHKSSKAVVEKLC